MPRLTKRNPSYRLHRATGQAVVTLSGKDHYLGPHGSPESKAEYDRLLAVWLNNGRRLAPTAATAPVTATTARPIPPAPPAAVDDLSIVELIVAYKRHVDGYYVKNGRPTSEPNTIRQALRYMNKLYGPTAARKFSPKKLKIVRQAMIDHVITRQVKVRDPETGETRVEHKVLQRGLSRRYINKQINRIRLMFGWAVEEELLPVAVHAALERVKPLRKGKSAAREKPRVRQAPPASIEAVLAIVPPTVRAMIEVQRLCGCRPQEVVEMRGNDIDRSGSPWEYRPGRHKTEHHNDDDDPDKDRVIYLGPRAQQALQPFLAAEPWGYLFSPVRAEQARNAERKRERKSPMTPSQAKRRPKGRARAPLRDHYDVASYRRAIRRACEQAGVPVFYPNQLRHTRLTEIRKTYGLEASRVCGGHSEIGTTQIYAEQDRQLARKVMGEVG